MQKSNRNDVFQNTTFTINKDGDISETVRLSARGAIREQIIMLNYIRHLHSFIFPDGFGFNINTRDNPLDFNLTIKTIDRKINFNIEITALSLNDKQLKLEKDQIYFKRICDQKKIKFYEFINIRKAFKLDDATENVYQKFLKHKTPEQRLIDNPIYGQQNTIFLSRSLENKPFKAQLMKSINSKVSKNHIDKQKTVLIIDNRTKCDKDCISQQIDNIRYKFVNTEFPEIWLYTGYYSDITGNETQFCMLPIKINHIWENAIINKLNTSPISNNIMYLKHF